MSLKGIAGRIEGRLAAMDPATEAHTLDVVRNVVLWYRYAFQTLDGELLTDLGLGAMEFIIKAKAGFQLEPMILTVRRGSPRLDRLITRLQEEIGNGEGRNSSGVELGPRDPAVAHESGSARSGPAAAGQVIAASSTTAAITTTRR